MAVLGPLALAASVASTIVGGFGALASGAAAESEAKFKAEQYRNKANEERAAGQRQMFEKRRETDFAQSKLIANAAAASGDTTDTGVLNLGGDIAARGEYGALTELYKGENAARGSEDAASAVILAGKNARTASYWKAGGTLLEGASSFGDKYKKVYG